MDLRQFRYYIEVAEQLSFTRAARRLRISQPTLSQQIRALERIVGTDLLMRGPSGPVLTQAGLAFLGRARVAVREAQAAVEDARSASAGFAGQLNIACGPVAEYCILQDVLALAKKKIPKLRFRLRFLPENEQILRVLNHTSDVGFMGFFSPATDPQLKYEPLYPEHGVVMIPSKHRLAHCRGSFAAQQYVLDHSYSIDGLALSGSGILDGLAKLARRAVPKKNNFSNAAFEPARTPFDWLCRDPRVVDAFMNDPLCFGALEPASAQSFLGASTRLADPDALSEIRPDLPMYLFSGSNDPVGQQLEGVRTLIERYHKAGVSDISYDFYEGGRHEMLNEPNRGQVRTNLLVWLSGVLGMNDQDLRRTE